MAKLIVVLNSIPIRSFYCKDSNGICFVLFATLLRTNDIYFELGLHALQKDKSYYSIETIIRFELIIPYSRDLLPLHSPDEKSGCATGRVFDTNFYRQS